MATDNFSLVGSRFTEYWIERDPACALDEDALLAARSKLHERRAEEQGIEQKLDSFVQRIDSASGHENRLEAKEMLNVAVKEYQAKHEEGILALRGVDEVYAKQAAAVLKHIPIVEVAVKVIEISEYDMKKMEFSCKIILMMNWRDESLFPFTRRINNSKIVTYDGVLSEENLCHHFVPRLVVADARSFELLGKPQFAISKTSPVDVKYTAKMALTIGALPDLTNFPFDIQILQLQMALQKLTFVQPPSLLNDGNSADSHREPLSVEQCDAMAHMAPSKTTIRILTDPVRRSSAVLAGQTVLLLDTPIRDTGDMAPGRGSQN